MSINSLFRRWPFKPWQTIVLSVGGTAALCMAGVATVLIAQALLSKPPSGPTESSNESAPVEPPDSTLTVPVSATTEAPSITVSPTVASTPSATLTLVPTLPAVWQSSCIPSDTQRQVAIVERVIDGDTIEVSIGGQIYPVRYIGNDSPEMGAPFSSESRRQNEWLLGPKIVTLIRDVSEVDKYDRLLRYVLAGDIFVNYEMIATGHASAATYPPDVACSHAFAQAQEQARQRGWGLWSPTETPKPTSTKPIPTTTSLPSSSCHPSYQGECLLMGAGDYDCGCGSGNGPNYVYGRVRVVGYDEFGLDRDGDGWGCECYP